VAFFGPLRHKNATERKGSKNALENTIPDFMTLFVVFCLKVFLDFYVNP